VKLESLGKTNPQAAIAKTLPGRRAGKTAQSFPKPLNVTPRIDNRKHRQVRCTAPVAHRTRTGKSKRNTAASLAIFADAELQLPATGNPCANAPQFQHAQFGQSGVEANRHARFVNRFVGRQQGF